MIASQTLKMIYDPRASENLQEFVTDIIDQSTHLERGSCVMSDYSIRTRLITLAIIGNHCVEEVAGRLE